MTLQHNGTQLRQALLSVAVREDADLNPSDDGVWVEDVLVDWFELQQACGGHDPLSPTGRRRLTDLLRLRAWVAGLGAAAAEAIAETAQLIALPADHVDHLGASWSRRPVAGGALWCGLGLATTTEPGTQAGPNTATRMVALPPSVLRAAAVDLDVVWQAAHRHAVAMSSTAAELLGSTWSQTGRLNPVGDCDVLTLLAMPPLRRVLAAQDGVGMRTVAVPDRRYGWYDMSQIDPDYLPIAWHLTEPQDRGVEVPLLITRDEVVAVRPRGSRRGGEDLSRPWAAPA